jgi:hypothetical protein
LAFILLGGLYNSSIVNETAEVDGCRRMTKKGFFAYILILTCCIFAAGCVERRLTIITKPQGAMVELNDEPLGTAPVTTSFNWYGDYRVRLSKDGYETLNTHRPLKAPWYDYFPFDFFAQILYPGRIVDSYEWTFELEPQKEITREDLIQKAEELKKQL